MNLQQAKELLGINQDDDEREIKRKYHNSLVKPESTDGKGQRIYHFKAFLAAPPQTVESTRIANLQPGEYLYPRAFHGNQIQLMNKERQILGYLRMEDEHLYFCIIPLLKRHAAQVKLLVKSDDAEEKGIYRSKYAGNSSASDRSRIGNHATKADIDFYFRLEDESYNRTDLNLKIAELLSEYEKYLQQGRFSDLFQRLARSNFRSRFHLKEKDRQYIQEKGIPSAVTPGILCVRGWHLPRFQTMASRLPCVDIRYFWRSMPQAAVAAVACTNGTEFPRAYSLLRTNRTMW